jgi:hypothetical protein
MPAERISPGRAARMIMKAAVILAALSAAFLWGAALDHLGYLGP